LGFAFAYFMRPKKVIVNKRIIRRVCPLANSADSAVENLNTEREEK